MRAEHTLARCHVVVNRLFAETPACFCVCALDWAITPKHCLLPSGFLETPLLLVEQS